MLRQMMESSQADDSHKRIERQKLEAMLGLCEITSCRRQALLAYFDDPLEQPCGNCDTCLEPPQTWDGTEEARKALSCVYRTGQRFGVNYLIDILLGKENERIQSFGHQQISTWGIGTALDVNQWRSVFRQLVALGYITVDVGGHGSLQLTDLCRPVLRGEQQLKLRKDRKKEKKYSAGRKKHHLVGEADSLLWDALRERRKELAEKYGVPPYVVFHDATLMEMVELRPQTLTAFSRISGVGQHKLDQYGKDFIIVICEHDGDESMASASDTALETLRLFRQGTSVKQVASQRGLQPQTIYNHLTEAIVSGSIKLEEVVTLSNAELKTIQDAVLQCTDLNTPRLKPVYKQLGESYDYEIIRCVVADLQKQQMG